MQTAGNIIQVNKPGGHARNTALAVPKLVNIGKGRFKISRCWLNLGRKRWEILKIRPFGLVKKLLNIVRIFKTFRYNACGGMNQITQDRLFPNYLA